jgi:hypothetical protein
MNRRLKTRRFVEGELRERRGALQRLGNPCGVEGNSRLLLERGFFGNNVQRRNRSVWLNAFKLFKFFRRRKRAADLDLHVLGSIDHVRA